MSSRGEVLRMGQKDSYKITTVLLILLHVVRGEICAENQYRPFLKDWCCTSKCGPGTRISRPCDEDDEDGTECEPCGEGLYNPGRDQDRCIPKDRCYGPNEEVKTNGTDRTDNVCQCKVGSYKDGEICRHGPVCQPGTGATRDGTCETCLDGTFSNETSTTQPCMSWTVCWKLGFVLKETGTNISDAICISRLAIVHTTRPSEPTTDTPAEKVKVPVAVQAGLGGVLAFAAVVSIIIGCICTRKRKCDRTGTGDGGGRETFPVGYPTALPDQVSLQIGEENTEEETLPLSPCTVDEMDMPTSELRSHPNDEGFSTGDDSCSDTLSELSAMTPASSETAIKISPAHEFNDPADMPVTEGMIAYLEQHLGRQYLTLARKLPFKDGTTGLPRTDIDTLKDCKWVDGMHEAIRKTIETWKTKNGDWANLKGLLIGLHRARMGHIVKHLCKEYNVSEAAIFNED